MEPIVKVEQAVREYGSDGVIARALRGVDLNLAPGEFTVMAGPSGSGKSTLLNLIGGLDKPTDGRVTIDGQELNNMSKAELSRLRRDKIGFIFQNYNLIPVMTAFENAEYVLMLQGMDPAKRKKLVYDLLAEVGLEGLEKRFPRELSGGQQQRVAIARAVASAPSLVLADEPTANVDSKTGAAILELMAGLNREKGVTFFLATHDRAVMRRARRLIRLRDGRIAADGPPEQVME